MSRRESSSPRDCAANVPEMQTMDVQAVHESGFVLPSSWHAQSSSCVCLDGRVVFRAPTTDFRPVVLRCAELPSW